MAHAYHLSHLVNKAASAHGIRRGDVLEGDILLLYTQNSIYQVRKLRHTGFSVSGGWFDEHHPSGAVTSIVGCTWGGSCIHRDFVASPGMRVEFGNRVLTSILQKVVRIPAALIN